MVPDWIRKSHEMWIEAEQIDLVEMQEEFRMQPFQGLKIAISGIEDCASAGWPVAVMAHCSGSPESDKVLCGQ